MGTYIVTPDSEGFIEIPDSFGIQPGDTFWATVDPETGIITLEPFRDNGDD